MKNILMIVCDQLSASALSVYGNHFSETPAIDKLAAEGVTFDRAYTTCPLCQPARASFWSGLYPHQTGVTTNLKEQDSRFEPMLELERKQLSSSIIGLGQAFAEFGYDCHHFGKEHDYGGLNGFKRHLAEQMVEEPEEDWLGLDYESFFDRDTTNKTLGFLKKKAEEVRQNPKTSPFLAVVDLENPHNICSFIGQHQTGGLAYRSEKVLPPLPDNFETGDERNRPDFVQYLCCAHRRQSQAIDWQAKDYQHYLYAYYYYLAKVDRQIGQIIKALEESGLADETLIVFMADHGEGMAAHRLVTKYGTFYDETVRVPFIISGRPLKTTWRGERYPNFFSLLDMYPTLLGYASQMTKNSQQLFGESHWLQVTQERIAKRGYQLAGQNHWPAVCEVMEATSATAMHGKAPVESDKLRGYAVTQWHDEFSGYYVPGRMYVDQSYKYICYQDKPHCLNEELYSMTDDFGEKKNLVFEAEAQSVLADYRSKLKDYCQLTKDPFYRLTADYDDKYRCHPAGYEYHSGDNAVLDYARRG